MTLNSGSMTAPSRLEGLDWPAELDTPLIAPVQRRCPPSRDLVTLYADRLATTGADVLPALRERRASLSGPNVPVMGYLAAPVPKIGSPIPIGRGTITHKRAREAIAATKWVFATDALPQALPVRMTRPAASLPVVMQAHRATGPSLRPVGSHPAPAFGFMRRIATTLAQFGRPAEPRPVVSGSRDSGVLEPSPA